MSAHAGTPGGSALEPPWVRRAARYNDSMLKVGLTGGLASGNTFVAGMFEQLGCAVVSLQPYHENS